MFLKIYFSEKKFNEEIENRAKQKIEERNMAIIRGYSSIIDKLRKARENVLCINTWDVNKKLIIDSYLIEIQDFLECPITKDVKFWVKRK